MSRDPQEQELQEEIQQLEAMFRTLDAERRISEAHDQKEQEAFEERVRAYEAEQEELDRELMDLIQKVDPEFNPKSA